MLYADQNVSMEWNVVNEGWLRGIGGLSECDGQAFETPDTKEWPPLGRACSTRILHALGDKVQPLLDLCPGEELA